MSVNIDQIIEIRDSSGKLCGTYHYDDPKSFFRGLYTPRGLDVIAPPPPEHPHHKGLQFGLCCRDVNFWEESLSAEPEKNQIPIGTQHTTRIERLAPGDGNGFTQVVVWHRENEVTFEETRIISVQQSQEAYVWTWLTTLTAKRDVEIIKSVWPGPGYCGLGLRLIKDLFENGQVVPAGAQSGDIPTCVSFLGKGVEVKFEQDASQANVLFVMKYDSDPNSFAFMSLGPTNASPRTLKSGEKLIGKYVVTVADV